MLSLLLKGAEWIIGTIMALCLGTLNLIGILMIGYILIVIGFPILQLILIDLFNINIVYSIKKLYKKILCIKSKKRRENK